MGSINQRQFGNRGEQNKFEDRRGEYKRDGKGQKSSSVRRSNRRRYGNEYHSDSGPLSERGRYLNDIDSTNRYGENRFADNNGGYRLGEQFYPSIGLHNAAHRNRDFDRHATEKSFRAEDGMRSFSDQMTPDSYRGRVNAESAQNRGYPRDDERSLFSRPYRDSSYYDEREDGRYLTDSYHNQSSYDDESYDLSSEGYAQQRNSYRGLGPKSYKRSDERIKEDVCECLRDDYRIDAQEISVDVQSGKVILSGNVTDKWMKYAAEDVIENLSGVSDIANEIKVKKHSSSGDKAKSSTFTKKSTSRQQDS